MTHATGSNHHRRRRRMVVFAGPHKSASSSVQELFMKHASTRAPSDDPSWKIQEHPHHPSLENWTWPWNPRRRSYLPRKGFAPLVTEEIGFHKLIWKTITEIWQTYETHNLIWGTEELDRFGKVPWSGRDGIEAIRGVQRAIIANASSTITATDVVDANDDHSQKDHLEVVVNYRRPRSGQWISIWKQLTRTQKTNQTYGAFLCNPKEYQRIWEYLDCVSNPMGLVQALLDAPPTASFNDDNDNTQANSPVVSESMTLPWKVHLLDMQGIANEDRDVGHVLACDVLGVPCTEDHWLPQITNRPIVKNAKQGHPGLTPQDMTDVEWVFLQRDCAYQQSFAKAQKEDRLTLHYADTLWEACQEHKPSVATHNAYTLFANTTFLLSLLQGQMGCGSTETSNIKAQTISDWRRKFEVASKADPKVAPTPSERSKHPPSRNQLDSLHIAGTDFSIQSDMKQVAHMQLLILYSLLLLVVAMLVRRFKCGKTWMPQRRLAGRVGIASRRSR